MTTISAYSDSAIYETSSDDELKILFVGTLPVLGERCRIDESEIEVWKQHGWICCESDSIFQTVKEKLLNDFNGEYYFLNLGLVGTHGLVLDEKYNWRTIEHDLNLPLTEEIKEKIANTDIIYIDSNTLGYIDSTKPAEYWIDMFLPYLSNRGCFVIDDDLCFPVTRRGYLYDKTYKGLTARILNEDPRGGELTTYSLCGFLSKFIHICKKVYPAILFRLGGKYENTSGELDEEEEVLDAKAHYDLGKYFDVPAMTVSYY